MEQKFTPDDGHIHQYLDGQCTWCGAPPDSDAPPGVIEAVPGTVTEVTIDMAELMKQARVFHVKEPKIGAPDGYETRPQTLMAFAINITEDAEIERFAGEAQKVLGWAKTLEITGGTSAKLVAGELRSISMLRRGVDLRAKDLIAPLADVLKDMKADLQKVTAPLAEADMIGRTKVTQWDAQQKKIQRDAEEATRLAAQAAEAARKVTDAGGEAPDLSEIEPVDIPADRGPLRPDSGGTVSMIDHWSAEVTDKQSIPSEYMEPNMQMLNMLARQRKGSDPIPGVKWVNNPTPSVR